MKFKDLSISIWLVLKKHRYVICLLIGVLLLYSPLLFFRKLLFTHDAIYWYPVYHYFVGSLSQGVFPLWDPYMQSGTPFYTNINLLGLLDPLLIIFAILIRFVNLSILDSYLWFYFLRIFLLAIGSYAVYSYLTRFKLAAFVGTIVLLLAFIPSSLRQNGYIHHSFLFPWLLLCILKIINSQEPRIQQKFMIYTALLTGLSFNLYLPAYNIFAIIVFLSVLLIIRYVKNIPINNPFKKENIVILIICIFITLFIMSPSLSVYLFDFSGSEKELFPSIRYIQSEQDFISTPILPGRQSQSLIDNLHTGGVYTTIYNFFMLLVPEFWWNFFIDYPIKDGFRLMEDFHYIGVFPIFWIFLSFLWSRSSYKYPAIITMILLAFSMLGSYELSGHMRGTVVQPLLRAIIPAYKILREYTLFLPHYLFCLSFLCVLGFVEFENKLLSSPKQLQVKLRNYICIFLLLFIAIIFYFESKTSLLLLNQLVVYKHVFVVSLVFSLFLLFILSFLVYGACILRLSPKFVVWASILILILDLTFYNLRILPFVTTDNYFPKGDEIPHHISPDKFETYRVPYLQRFGPFAAFVPSMCKCSVALPNYMHYGDHIFMLSRFYNYHMFVPPETQKVASAIIFPKFWFYAKYEVTTSQLESLKLLREIIPSKLNDIVFVEIPPPHSINKNPLTEINNPVLSPNFTKIFKPFIKQDYSAFYDVKGEKLSSYIINYKDKIPLLKKEMFGLFALEPGDFSIPYTMAFHLTEENNQISYKDWYSFSQPTLTIEAPFSKTYYSNHYLYNLSKTLWKTFAGPIKYNINDAMGDINPLNRLSAGPIKISSYSKQSLDSIFVYQIDTSSRIPLNPSIISVISFNINSVKVKVHNDQPGFLYYSDGFSRYWKVKEGEKYLQVFPANLAFKGVYLTRGEHILEWKFSPDHFKIALYLYTFGIITAIILCIVLSRRPAAK